jgi:hypothetical protein
LAYYDRLLLVSSDSTFDGSIYSYWLHLEHLRPFGLVV